MVLLPRRRDLYLEPPALDAVLPYTTTLLQHSWHPLRPRQRVRMRQPWVLVRPIRKLGPPGWRRLPRHRTTVASQESYDTRTNFAVQPAHPAQRLLSAMTCQQISYVAGLM